MGFGDFCSCHLFTIVHPDSPVFVPKRQYERPSSSDANSMHSCCISKQHPIELVLVVACWCNVSVRTTSAADASLKPRVIATTDGEVDDRSSMICFLLYACDFDAVGMVQVNSKFQKHGHSGKKWIEAQLDAHEQVLPNLRKYNSDYPDTAKLRSVMRIGNETEADQPEAELIAESPPIFVYAAGDGTMRLAFARKRQKAISLQSAAMSQRLTERRAG